ncbi:MAG: tetratricopeptide repeat protein [Armatimonadota bacterium]
MNSLVDNKNTISVCIIAKNESDFIYDCIKSLEDIADEVILVDTGSSDNTIELAKDLGAKIYQIPWQNDFSQARNKSIEYANGDWILWIDADERLDNLTKHNIKTAAADNTIDAYILKIYNYMSDDVDNDVVITENVRLWRNKPEYRFRYAIHESISDSIIENNGIIGSLNTIIHHFGYKPDIIQSRDKKKRNIDILQNELIKEPNNPHVLYHFAQEYFEINEFEKSSEYAKRAIDNMPISSNLAKSAYLILADSLSLSGKSHMALDVLNRAYDYGLYNMELSFAKARALLNIGRYDEAINEFKNTKELAKSSIGDMAAAGYKSDCGIATALYAKGDFESAYNICKELLEKHPNFADAREIAVNCLLNLGIECAKNGKLNDSIKSFDLCLELDNAVADAYYMKGEIFFAIEDYQSALESYTMANKLLPKNLKILQSIANCYIKQGNYSDAINILEEAITLAPENSQINESLKLCKLIKSKLKAA